MVKREKEELEYLRIKLDREKYKKLIKTRKLGGLMSWLSKIRPRVYEKEKKDDALWMIDEIEKEIRLRNDKGEEVMPLKKTSDERPDIGLLKIMGYTTGIEGESKEVRRDIMKAVCRGPIPFVDSAAYMQEWDKDGTKGRFRKLRNTLWGLRNRMGGYAEQAKKDYSDDIDWLDKNKSVLIHD